MFLGRNFFADDRDSVGHPSRAVRQDLIAMPG